MMHKLTTKLPPSECLKRLSSPTENLPSNIRTTIDEIYSSYFLPEGKSNSGTNIHISVKGNDFEILTKGWRKVPGGMVPARRKYTRLTGSVNDREAAGSMIECRFQNRDVATAYILLSVSWILSLLLSLVLTSAPEFRGKAWLLLLAFTCLAILQISNDVEHHKDIMGFIKVLLEADDSLTKEEAK